MQYVGPKTAAANLDLSPGFLRHVSAALLVDKPVEVYPTPGAMTGERRVTSDLAPHLYFCANMADLLRGWNEAQPAVGDEPPAAGFVGDPGQLEAVSGFLMRPTVYPPVRPYKWEAVDRLATREEIAASRLGPTRLTKEQAMEFTNVRHWVYGNQRALFVAVTQAYTEVWKAGTTYIPKGSSTGYWTFSTMEVIRRSCIRNVPRCIAAWAHSSAAGRADGFQRGGGIVASKAVRSQGDKPKKKRLTQTFDGLVVEADKTIGYDMLAGPAPAGPFAPSHFGRRRQRHANAASGEETTAEQFLFAGFDRHALTAYQFTWKHRHKLDLDEKLRPWKYAVCVDYTQFDSENSACWATVFNEVVLSRLTRAGRDAFARLLYAWDSPAFLRVDYDVPPLRRRFTLSNDPLLDGNADWWVGALSGLPRNPRFNKCSGTASQLWIVDLAMMALNETGGRWTEQSAAKAVARILAGNGDPTEGENRVRPESVPDILRGRDTRFAVLNCGDDCVTLTNDHDLWQALLWAASVLPNMVAEVDAGGRFLGYNICTEGGKLVAYPALVSRVLNFFMPEYSFGDPRHRPDAALGYEARDLLHYLWHPRCQELIRHERTEFARAWGNGASLRVLMARNRLNETYDPITQLAMIFESGVHTGRFELDDLNSEYVSEHYIAVRADDPVAMAAATWIRAENLNPSVEPTLKVWLSPPFQHPPGGAFLTGGM